MQSPLIDSSELASRLSEERVRILDARWLLEDPAWGAHAYAQGHFPGALFADLDRDLSRKPDAATDGRRPAPTKSQWTRALRAWGIAQDTHVVVYDDAGGAMAATRAWVLLRWAGIAHSQVLNGGLTAWRGPLESGSAERPIPSDYHPAWTPVWIAETEDVHRAIREGSATVIDARPPEEYAGSTSVRDPVPGHIPAAVNLPHERLLGPDGRMLRPSELQRVLRSHGADDEHAIASCGSGVWASQVLLARESAGLAAGRLFVGSWSAWSANPELPLARSS